MSKLVSVFCVVLLSLSITSQVYSQRMVSEADLIGQWNIEKLGGEILQSITFKSDGSVEGMGQDGVSWKILNNDESILMILVVEDQIPLKYYSDTQILLGDDLMLTIQSGSNKQKLNQTKISETDLVGSWKMENLEGDVLPSITFKSDGFVEGRAAEGQNWEIVNNGQSILMLSEIADQIPLNYVSKEKIQFGDELMLIRKL